MSYLRRDKKKRVPKEITGNQKVITPEEIQQRDSTTPVPADMVRDVANDLATLSVLEDLEDTLGPFEDEVDDRLDNLNLQIDPGGLGTPEGPSPLGLAKMGILEALKNLNDGVPTTVLDKELLQRAMDITLDSQTHMAGFDVLAVVLSDYGTQDGIPMAPMPKPFGLSEKRLTCSEQQQLKNIPDIDEIDGTDPDAEVPTMAKITDVFEKTKRLTFFDLIMKLIYIILYFIWKVPYDFLKKLVRRPIKKVIRKIRKYIKKKMDKYWCYVTGECGDSYDLENEIEDSIIDSIDEVPVFEEDGFLEGRGINCIESAGVVMDYVNKNMADNVDVRAFSRSTEKRQELEAIKHGEISNIKNKTLLKDRILELDSKTKDSPRFRRRYYGARRKTYPWTV